MITDASPPLDDAALMRRMEELERAEEEEEEEEVHIRAAQSGTKVLRFQTALECYGSRAKAR